jgi:hypothetical protein
MSKTYQVSLSADFLTKADAPETIREKLKRAITAQGFEERNFEITVSRLSSARGGEGDKLASKPARKGVTKHADKNSKRPVRRKAKSRKQHRT